ncbi:MAG TPA: FG-GAP-like repeat-containing protein [Vicinamibacteria bacterium]|nr:FG-GAP-like repeat-containing protein [Vicinamibacteria bacterium]
MSGAHRRSARVAIPLSIVLCVPGCGESDASGEPERLAVVGTTPVARSVAAPAEGTIMLRFDRPVQRDSVTSRSLRVLGRWSGPADGTVAFEDSDRAVVFSPRRPFSAGESVSVTLSRALAGADGTTLRPEGYALSFWTRARPASLRLDVVERLSTRPLPHVEARAYGGVASDLDGDGRLDLAIVNEDTADVAVFLNDGGFRFRSAGRAAVGRRASPAESADFDGDGRLDLAVANIADATVSILPGRGDGSFGTAATVAVGETPRGIAVLDADGDGDPDVAVASFGANGLTLLLNDGAGRFAAGSALEAGVDGEWALAAADMDGDGVMDLVVGGQGSERIAVLRGRGDARFEPAGSQAAGGGPWMLVTGDLDRDGREDVAVVNGRSNTASVLRGDGRGGLEAARLYPIAPFGLASDLGDMDGDGDLDWLTSSYSGEWRLFDNRGDGGFDLRSLFRAPQAASCALPFDADGDGDLDLALIDEEADEVILVRNEG